MFNLILLDSSKMTYRQLGFGEPISERETFLFQIVLSLLEFQQIIENDFNKFVTEIKNDDEKYGDIVEDFFKYNYPSFEKLLQVSRQTLSKVILDYLFFELLEGLFDKNDACIYVVNRLDNINIDQEKVYINGEAYFI